MSKVRDISNLSNIIKTDASGNVSFVSGSTTLATLNTSGQLSGSSPVLSSSYALNATSASYALSASNATNAITASYANAFTVANTLTAQTLVVQTITSSVLYSSGSNVFGNNIANTHMMTGSLLISGSVGIGTTPSARLEIKQVNSLDYRGLLVVDSATPNWIGLAHTGTTGVISVGYDGAGTYYPMVFKTGDTERMRITNSGSVGIGTSSPSTKLGISGTAGNVVTDMGNGDLIDLYGGTISSANEGIGIGFTRAGSQMAYIKAARESTGSNEAAFLAFATQTSGGTHPERMRITSTGNVGIGTSSPSSIFQVSSTASLAAIRSTTTTNYAEVQIENTTNYLQVGVEGATGNRMGGTVAYNAYLGSYANYGMTFHTNNLNRMTITSGGIVTKPYQPAFSVYQVSQNGGSGIMTYSTTILNRGNCVNLNNGRFTAPVAGAYQITFMAFQQSGNTDVLSCVFYINGANSAVRTYQNDSDTGYGPHQTLSAVLSLAANDYVYVNVTSGTIHGNEDGFFSGFLIG